MLKINFLGDSITENCFASSVEKGFVYLVGQMTNSIVRNYGIGGTRIARQHQPSDEPRWDLDFPSRVDEMDHDADYVFVFGGTNDYGHGDAEFGQLGDKTVFTFYGAVDYLINKLLEHYKKEQIIFIIPLYRANEDSPYGDGRKKKPGHLLSEYRQAIYEVVGSYGIKILDIKDQMGKAEGNPLLCDGLHPNDAGHQKLAELISEYIKTLPKEEFSEEKEEFNDDVKEDVVEDVIEETIEDEDEEESAILMQYVLSVTIDGNWPNLTDTRVHAGRDIPLDLLNEEGESVELPYLPRDLISFQFIDTINDIAEFKIYLNGIKQLKLELNQPVIIKDTYQSNPDNDASLREVELVFELKKYRWVGVNTYPGKISVIEREIDTVTNEDLREPVEFIFDNYLDDGEGTYPSDLTGVAYHPFMINDRFDTIIIVGIVDDDEKANRERYIYRLVDLGDTVIDYETDYDGQKDRHSKIETTFKFEK